MILTSEYNREQNQLLHRIREGYGTGGDQYIDIVLEMSKHGKKTVLDYGCGKAYLAEALPFAITNYDPCIPEHNVRPCPHSLVVCTDVLEHIEPEYLDNVLADLRFLTKDLGFFSISCRPAVKTLPDGRNTHLIQESADWWRNKLIGAGFNILEEDYITERDSGYFRVN